MQWIKASERLPTVGVYNALYNGDHAIFQVHDGGFRIINYHGEKDDNPRLHLIKWLDDSTPSLTLQQGLDIWDAAIDHYVSVSDFDCESLPNKSAYFASIGYKID